MDILVVAITAGIPLLTSVVLWWLNRRHQGASTGDVITQSAERMVKVLEADNERLRRLLAACDERERVGTD